MIPPLPGPPPSDGGEGEVFASPSFGDAPSAATLPILVLQNLWRRDELAPVPKESMHVPAQRMHAGVPMDMVRVWFQFVP
jgi:hypothetical protein